MDTFWQYPVITEKTFFDQEKYNPFYLGFPWASALDNKCGIPRNIQPIKDSYTCCQHIHFRRLIPLFYQLGIRTLYTPHKIKDEDDIWGIAIKPCPLYAINVENTDKNKAFKDVNFETVERPYLYSFMGGYQSGCYLTDIRPRIFNMKHTENTHVVNTGDWHFNPLVYTDHQNANCDMNVDQTHRDKTEEYNDVLLKSRYSLCPSGSGPNSIRFWESLAVGTIPILLSDTLDLPEHELWDATIVRVDEKDLESVTEITREDEAERRKNCLTLYEHFKNNYCNRQCPTIVHYCCGSYESGDHGGVARYDHQIKLAFPERVFFQGPQQKNQMNEFIKSCHRPLVITDNHLSLDIPNEYKVLLVHHGCAKTTAIHNPTWEEPWKSLCCDGQDKMLKYRNPETTEIISISQSCTDDFTKYYGDVYTKFRRHDILHPSELDEAVYKKEFTNVDRPVILGNWGHVKKGRDIIGKLKDQLDMYVFQQLKVSIQEGNDVKQSIYCKADMFLQLSTSEGNSYATLDALICGLPVISTNVGLFENNVPHDCFVCIDKHKLSDTEYIKDRISYAWEHREQLSTRARKWYMNNCRFTDWVVKMQHLRGIACT